MCNYYLRTWRHSWIIMSFLFCVIDHCICTKELFKGWQFFAKFLQIESTWEIPLFWCDSKYQISLTNFVPIIGIRVSLAPEGLFRFWICALENKKLKNGNDVQIQHLTSAETRMWGKWPAAMLAIYTSKGVTPEVNFRECILRMPLSSVNKVAHSGFETQRRCHQKSKTGVSVAPKMDMCPTKSFKKKNGNDNVISTLIWIWLVRSKFSTFLNIKKTSWKYW